MAAHPGATANTEARGFIRKQSGKAPIRPGKATQNHHRHARMTLSSIESRSGLPIARKGRVVENASTRDLPLKSHE
jgi:hypothetical protein